MRKSSYRTGLLAEALAKWFLRAKGYRILAQRYKVRGGEIDIIASRWKVLAFVEVKARASKELAAYAITEKGKKRMTTAVKTWLMKHPEEARKVIRYDAMLIKLPFFVKHLDNAWMD